MASDKKRRKRLEELRMRDAVDYFSAFGQMADLAVEEAELLLSVIGDFDPAALEGVLARAHEIEAASDRLVDAVVVSADGDFVTPIGRDNIVELAIFQRRYSTIERLITTEVELRYDAFMPSWSIHTAHVERLLAECEASELGIEDANAFLFGNYVPDIYLGFMVHDTTYRLDYCLTHAAEPHVIPVPDADRFWDECIVHPIRCPKTPSARSLTLGAWAHLAADRLYNARFRAFCKTHDVPSGDELRVRKQADFALFGHSLDISKRVSVTPELLDAARAFRPYSVLPDDVRHSVEVMERIIDEPTVQPDPGEYQLLGSDWMTSTFEACNQLIATWLQAAQKLHLKSAGYGASDIREQVTLPEEMPL